MWVVFIIPTVLISLDFEKVSLGHRKTFIEHAHYFAVFLWVMGNFAGAYGEIISTEVPGPAGQPILVIHEKAGVTTLDFFNLINSTE